MSFAPEWGVLTVSPSLTRVEPIFDYIVREVIEDHRGNMHYDAKTDELTVHLDLEEKDLIAHPFLGRENAEEIWFILDANVKDEPEPITIQEESLGRLCIHGRIEYICPACDNYY